MTWSTDRLPAAPSTRAARRSTSPTSSTSGASTATSSRPPSARRAPPKPTAPPRASCSRRPDVAAARARVEAAAARIGAAKADFYPNINLNAFLGFDALTLHGLDLFSAGSRTAGVGPAIHLPVFEAGRLQAGLRGRYGE